MRVLLHHPMRVLLQRVREARVTVDGHAVGAIGAGLLLLVGVHVDDTPDDRAWLVRKILALRIFDDDQGRMSEPLGAREILCVSQFTLYGDTRRGTRPSYTAAAPADQAQPLYERFCARSGARAGVFGARMAVELVNDGPVTLLLEV